MLFAFGPEDLQRLAIPIGIVVAVIVALAVPALRRDLVKSYESGKSFRQKHKVAAYALDAIGVLLIAGVVAYFVFYR